MNDLRLKNIFLSALILVLICLGNAPLVSAANSQLQSANEQAKKEKIDKMFNSYRKWFFSKAQIITVDEFLELRSKEEVILIDKRSEKERKISMIPSAISQEEFESRKDGLLDKKIVVYCTIGLRSGRYSQKLMKQGFNAYNLKGGMLSWAHSHQNFLDKNGETYRVHVYGKKWALLPDGYQAVY